MNPVASAMFCSCAFKVFSGALLVVTVKSPLDTGGEAGIAGCGDGLVMSPAGAVFISGALPSGLFSGPVLIVAGVTLRDPLAVV